MASINNELALYSIDVENTEEMDRLIKQANLISELVGLLPPQITLTVGQVVLDIGCGPGEWALEMAQHYPDCQIRGMDLSQRMIVYANACARLRRLPNVLFTVADALQSFPFPDASFDVVHARFVAGFLQVSTWPVFLKECVRVLRPSGILCNTELEHFGSSNSSALTHYTALFVEYLRLGQHCFTPDGSVPGITAVQASLLQHSGLTSIQQSMHVLNYSFGTPAHESIAENYAVLLQLIQPALVREKIISQKDLHQLYTQTMADMYAEGFCAINSFQTVWGQKPGETFCALA